MTRMIQLHNIYTAVYAFYKSNNWVEFQINNPEQYKIVINVVELEKAINLLSASVPKLKLTV